MTPEEGAAWRIASFLGWKVLHSLFDDATCTSIQTFVDSVKSNPASLEKLTLPAKVSCLEQFPEEQEQTVTIKLREGRYHQVRACTR